MDLEQEETIATDDDSDDGDADHSRWMLTEHQFSSATVASLRVLSEEITPQIDLQCRTGQSRNTSTTKQQTHSAVVTPTHPVRVRALVNEEGSSSEREPREGWTPLHEAVQRNKYDKTEILLEAGAEVSCRGHNGITPLHDAIYCQYYKIVELLLKYGADPLSKCDRGKTPLEMTTDRSMYILVEKYLQRSKSDPAENPPITDSAVNPSLIQRNNQISIKETRAPLQKSTGTANTSGHESSLQSGEAELIPGPSRGQPSCDPSMRFQASFKVKPSPQTSINVLWPLRDQEQDQNSEGSDTSGCLDSDVTVDYIEDYSSSPEHWTLCATQDFSGS
uniref:Ankyrin repeat domain 31 n=1 Tax=Cyprinus carpio carpio TaxID=630221 RepID=A0A8C1D629_CYPCA